MPGGWRVGGAAFGGGRIGGAAVLAAVALAAAAPGAAMAAKLLPPGNSAVNQYTEPLPGPEGNVAGGAVKGGRSPAKALGAAKAARLEALGPEGRAAARLAAATAPAAAARGGSGRGAGHGGAGGGAPLAAGSSGLGEVLGQITGTSGSGGTGLLLPLVIALALAGSLAFLAARRRTGHSHD
jgi:hypothetical protein